MDQHTCNHSVKSTYTYTSSDDEIGSETTPIAEPNGGFQAPLKNELPKFMREGRKKEDVSKVFKRSNQIRIILLICLMYLVTQGIFKNNEDDGNLSRQLVLRSDPQSPSTHTGMDGSVRKFAFNDLQHILFWFLLFTQIQRLTEKPKKIRRAWKSRVIPVN